MLTAEEMCSVGGVEGGVIVFDGRGDFTAGVDADWGGFWPVT